MVIKSSKKLAMINDVNVKSVEKRRKNEKITGINCPKNTIDASYQGTNFNYRF